MTQQTVSHRTVHHFRLWLSVCLVFALATVSTGTVFLWVDTQSGWYSPAQGWLIASLLLLLITLGTLLFPLLALFGKTDRFINAQHAQCEHIAADSETLAAAYIRLLQGEKVSELNITSQAAAETEDSFTERLVQPLNRIISAYRRMSNETARAVPALCKRVFYVGGDTYFEGYTAGKEIDIYLKAHGTVAIISGTRMNMQIRLKGFRAALRERQSEITIVDTGLSQSQPDISYSYAQSFLEKYPGLDLFYITEGISAEAVLQAIQEAGKQEQVRIVCHDLLSAVVRGIEEGSIVCAISQDPQLQGYETPILLFNHILTGWVPDIPRILNSCTVVTRSNCNEYWNTYTDTLKPIPEHSKRVSPERISEKPVKIGFICPDNHEFWLQLIESAEQAKQVLSQANCTLDIRIMQFTTVNEIEQILTSLDDQGFDGICLPIFDTRLVPIINRLSDAGIKIATFNTEPNSTEFSDPQLMEKELDHKISLSAQAEITHRTGKMYQSEREQRIFVEALMAVSKRLNNLLDTNTIFTILLEEIHRVFSFDSGSIFLTERDKVKVIQARGYSDKSPEAEEFMQTADFKLSDFPTYHEIVQTGLPLLISDTNNDPRWYPIPETAYIQSWIGCPICVEGKVIAVFSLDKDEPGYFTAQHVHQLQAFAGQAAMAVRNAMLFSELSTMAKTDPLTGLPNRREFEEQGSSELKRCKRYNREVSILMLDLDFFKSINDNYGHAAGDSVLKALSANLRASLRMADIACRYGGEEFVVLAPETHLSGAAELAERIRVRMETTFVSIGDETITITVSIGLSSTNGRSCSLEQLIDEADKALYAAKSGGRNAVFAWDTETVIAEKQTAGKHISTPEVKTEEPT